MSQNSPEVFVVNADDPEAQCPLGKELLVCEAARILLKNAASFRPMKHLTATDSMRRHNTLYDLQIGCVECRHEAVARLDMDGREIITTDLVFTPAEKNTTFVEPAV